MTVDKSPERVRRMFGQIAGRYDFLNHVLSLGTDVWWRHQTVRRVPPSGPLPILDVCTGTGDLALAYDRAAGGRTPIVAADFCHEMLALGRTKAKRAGADGRITFIEADAQALPLPTNAFQIVCVAFGLRNVADTDRGLAEMARVCAPGGRVAVLEFSMPTRQPFKAIYGEDGRRVGFDVDMVREFARRWLGDPGKATLLPVPTDARIRELLNGKGDIIAAALTDTPERRQEIDFSITYFKDGQRILVPEASSVAGVCDLAGSKVAAIRASTSLDNLKRAAAECGFTPDLVEFRRHADAVEALIKGEVAAFTSDGIALENFAEGRPLKVVGNHFSDEPYGFGLPKGDRRFRELVDATLAEMQADGTFAAIYQKWFGDSIAPYPLDLSGIETASIEVAAASPTETVPVVEPAAPPGPPPTEYVVQPGDTLSKIAGKLWGDVGPASWRRIYDANRDLIGDDPAKIEVGMKLAIPET